MSTKNYTIFILVLVFLSGCAVVADEQGFKVGDPVRLAEATHIAEMSERSAEATRQAVSLEATRTVADIQARERVEAIKARGMQADTDKKIAAAKTAQDAQPAQAVGQSLAYIGLGVGALVLAIGTAFGVTAWVSKRATTIYPNKQGQFPIIVRRGLGWIVFHDPSRGVGPGAVYKVPSLLDAVTPKRLPPASADYPLPNVSEAALLATASQSNATAMVVAQNRWPKIALLGKAPIPIDQPHDTIAPEIQSPASLPAQELPSRVPLKYMLAGSPPSLARLALGITLRDGSQIQTVYGDLSRMVHILAAGASGWGKSQFLKMLIYQLALSHEPCSLVLADMERTTFGAFGRCSRLMFPIIDSEKDLAAVMGELVGQLEQRKESFAEFPDVDTLAAYNERADKPLSPIVLAIDEATSFLVDGSVADGLKTLVRRGRKYGLWVTAGGQTFGAKDVDTATSLQFSSRIQFRAPVKSGSQTLVDSKDAKALECPGRAILVLPGQEAIKIQTPTVSYDEIMAAFGGQSGPQQHMATSSKPGQADQIRLLAGDGLTPSQIAEQVFGYKNARIVERIRSILDGDTFE